MRSEIALPLTHVLHLYSVGNLLKAWRSPQKQRTIEQLFDSPEQAHHAVAVCAAWLGIRSSVTNNLDAGKWWPSDESKPLSA